jgi:c-di-GMP-binding flagellar brake protein YcgR
MNQTWAELSQAFRKVSEITIPRDRFMLLTILTAVGLMLVWIGWGVYLRKRRSIRFFRDLKYFQLNDDEYTFFKEFVRQRYRNHPQHSLESVSSYNTWLDEKLGRARGENLRRLATLAAGVRRKVFAGKHPALPLSSSRDLHLNEIVTVIVSQGSGTRGFYQGVVTDMDELSITISLSEKQVLPAVDQVEISLAHVEAMYVFKARVLKVPSGGGNPLVTSHALEFRVIQHRQFYRQRVNFTVHFRLVRENLQGEKPEIIQGRGRLVDLSGGGCSLLTDVKGKVGDRIYFNLVLGEKVLNNLMVRIVRTDDLESGDSLLHGAFENIEDQDRDDIVKFVFQKQLEIF